MWVNSLIGYHTGWNKNWQRDAVETPHVLSYAIWEADLGAKRMELIGVTTVRSEAGLLLWHS